MATDIKALIEYYENEKGLDYDQVLEALQNAFVAAYCKVSPGFEKTRELSCRVNPQKGEVKIFANLEVSENGEKYDSYNQVPLSKAVKVYPEAKIFEILKFDVTPKRFGRIAIHNARYSMRQYLREVEKKVVYDEFKDRVGEIISVVVRVFEGKDVILDLGRFEGRMPMSERVFGEDYSQGDRIRVYVKEVKNMDRGVDIILSRKDVEFIHRLFEMEVTELSDGTVEIKKIVRDPGYRTKISVSSSDPKVDPVGSCVGLRGMRVKNIVREINNEKIDIIEYHEDIRDLVTEALKPANPTQIKLDEENHIVYISLNQEDLSKAIGKRGQNARLTSELVGWDVQIREDETGREKFEQKLAGAASNLSDLLGLDEEQGDKLLRAGGINLELIQQMPADYIAQVLEADLSKAKGVLKKVNQALASEASEKEEGVSTDIPEKKISADSQRERILEELEESSSSGESNEEGEKVHSEEALKKKEIKEVDAVEEKESS